MNLQPLRKNIIVLIEYYQDYLRFYYADGHSEIIQDSIHSYLHTDDKGYKRPIQVYNQELYPTQNKKDVNCRWINLSYIDEQDVHYMCLLKEKGLIDKCKKMYLKYKEKQLFDIY